MARLAAVEAESVAATVLLTLLWRQRATGGVDHHGSWSMVGSNGVASRKSEVGCNARRATFPNNSLAGSFPKAIVETG